MPAEEFVGPVMARHLALVVTLAILAISASPAHAQDKRGICFVLYTTHERVLKLTAQLYPLDENDERDAHLPEEPRQRHGRRGAGLRLR